MTHQPDRDSPDALEEALRAAWAPGPIDRERHEGLLAAALEDPLAPASPEEQREAERLRRALEGDGAHPGLELARALRAAVAPEPERRALRALPSAEPRRVRGRYYAALAVSLAAAAAVALRSGVFSSSAEPDKELSALARSRSTAGLFRDFSQPGGATERIDRIAELRSRELRDNLYQSWGVR